MPSFFENNPSSLQTLQKYIERKLDLPAKQQYAYTMVNKKDPKKILIISNYPKKWIETYKESKLQFIDPVISKALRQSLPFKWDENLNFISDINFTKVFSLSSKYNIENGHTFVLHDHFSNLCLLSFIVENNNHNAEEDKFLIDENIMQMQLIDFNAQTYKLIEAGSMKNTFNTSMSRPIFTQREHEVLYWASMGKTYPEVSSMLSISVSTVKFHMSNVINKLQVTNARQAIRQAVAMDLIK